ncbi:response regulator [Hirschia maritima]|uniref:response regulator n=1 Tax=Hirschia maritima TaxID=1121961 RepID=UPI0003809DCC|nr:response regulator [Hirschia maritima]
MRVLFVDDDAMNRRVVKDMLEVAGVVMDEAVDGQEGVDKVEQSDYDVVLMDLRMPGMDGLTAIGHIRERSDDKASIPIIVVTADTSVNIKEDCISGGADDVMAKPVAMKPLFKTMAQYIAAKAKKN